MHLPGLWPSSQGWNSVCGHVLCSWARHFTSHLLHLLLQMNLLLNERGKLMISWGLNYQCDGLQFLIQGWPCSDNISSIMVKPLMLVLLLKHNPAFFSRASGWTSFCVFHSWYPLRTVSSRAMEIVNSDNVSMFNTIFWNVYRELGNQHGTFQLFWHRFNFWWQNQTQRIHLMPKL